jgi:hypothetical protein
MNVDTENDYQTKDKGKMLLGLKEEDNTGQSTMKNSSLMDQNFEEEKSGRPAPAKPDTIKVEQRTYRQHQRRLCKMNLILPVLSKLKRLIEFINLT